MSGQYSSFSKLNHRKTSNEKFISKCETGIGAVTDEVKQEIIIPVDKICFKVVWSHTACLRLL
jgi:hypothetical protein